MDPALLVAHDQKGWMLLHYAVGVSSADEDDESRGGGAGMGGSERMGR